MRLILNFVMIKTKYLPDLVKSDINIFVAQAHDERNPCGYAKILVLGYAKEYKNCVIMSISHSVSLIDVIIPEIYAYIDY